ncbi:bifunctional 2',3'-cyclic-nucleotide 2'-phosphodiesterase/3'-nucleotidase [Cohnella nanjingensis]|uniref:Bifunctional 2',3'-cyclic-nucleotide 2'-phosphodiesterase/3'-nucleotidase n=2 Tax=Cohnella nanjingensis TaxID=1387779 RepID=A0A7X0VJX3_9BACL|nr:bifunctional 2',3'-cyclic-nucleotide 2'-phosphodiesterase/3'-nucleotidase [Cohnella nanjingensis]MBB6675189.1 bifunctional 2',3'-cyclic-nucleotide 2'-phosphodiesterase/3'-nucleotidase [Cohnella nanjingensis]
MSWRSLGRKTASSAIAAAVLSVQVLGGIGWFGTSRAAAAAEAPPLHVRLLDTTDLHTNIMGYDYFKGADAVTIGMDRTATLIKQARAEQPNTLLFDNGDLIQGTPLGTYMAKVDKLSDSNAVHPMIKAMNLLQYDAATLGNHEFNYGLDYLNRVYQDAKFPYLNANVYVDNGSDGDPSNDTENKFTPYVILDKTFKDDAGQDQQVKIGVIGLVTPQIMEWDKVNLAGKVTTKDIAQTAQTFVPLMKAAGADVIVALAHTGFDANAQIGDMSENDVNALSKVPGIDAIAFSHTHKIYPTGDNATLDTLFKDPATKLPYNNGSSVVNNTYGPGGGTINSVPATQAGFGGANLGLIDLTLVKDAGGKWTVDKAQSSSSTRSIYRTEIKVNIANVTPDQSVRDAVNAEHDATVAYTNQRLGDTDAPIHSYFAMVQDDPSIQIVTDAQKWYVEKYIADHGLDAYKDTPILSAGAPFKAGRNGPSEYTDIDTGPLTIRSASDLYLYDNTLKAVLIKGSTVKEWLEMSAGAFNQIDPGVATAQPLLDSSFAVYNFDVLDGVTYQIDVTKNAKYKPDGSVNDASSSRIVNLQYKGQPIDPNQDFLVVTNNYRASGGGNFPGLKGSQLIVDTQDENRQVLMDYIASKQSVSPSADGNWSIAPIPGDVKVTFTSSPAAAKYAAATNGKITDTGTRDAKDFEIYNLKLGESGGPSDGLVEVHLLGINDLHGQLDTTSFVSNKPVGTAPILAAYLKEARAKYANSLLVHNGDSVGASAPVSSLERDEPTMEWMNLMKFDVGTLGNHEFDQGVASLKTQLDGGVDPVGGVMHKGADFDYVNANVVDEKTGKPIIAPYVVKEIGGVKIGFIGVVTMATVTKVSPEGLRGVKLVDQAPVVNEAVAELKQQGVKTIVVLAHDPATTKDGVTTGEAADLAKAVDPEVDVIMAGDNHALANGLVDGKLVVQAYSYGTAFEDVKLLIDPNTGDVTAKSATVTTTFQDGVTPDAESLALVNQYLDKHPELKQPVGTTDGSVVRTDAYNNEAPLGNLIADAMRSAFPDTDFAFMNPGGIRADLPTGEVKFGDLAKVQPFGNTLVKLTLTGKQIKTLLQQQWGKKVDGTPDTKTLQISGLKYTAYMGLDVDKRVTTLTKADGTPIEDDKTYTAVVNNFMAAGGDNYKVLTEATDAQVGPTDLDVFYKYIVDTFKGGAITAKLEGRITNKEGVPDTEGPTPSPSPTPTPTPTPGTGGPTPSPSPLPTPTPTPTPGTVTVAIAEKDVPKPVNGVVTIPVSLPTGATAANVSLPLNLAELAGNGGTVQFNLNGVSVSLPARVLADAAKLVPTGGADGATLTLNYERPAAAAVTAQLAGAQTANTNVAAAGAVVKLGLSASAKNGNSLGSLTGFAEPLVVSVQLDAGANPKRTNLYRIEDGRVTYVPAKLQDGKLTAAVNGPGTYGALTYDRSFADVAATYWAHDVIAELAAKQMVDGTEAASFSPLKSVTRAEFAKLLVTEFRLKAKTGTSGFTDVATGSWYADYVAIAASNGLITGYEDGRFNPNAPITREQMAVMLARIPALKGTNGQSSFKDNGKISSWARDAVGIIAGSGLMQGRGNDTFAPQGLTTRAEAAKVVHSLLGTAETGGGF